MNMWSKICEIKKAFYFNSIFNIDPIKSKHLRAYNLTFSSTSCLVFKELFGEKKLFLIHMSFWLLNLGKEDGSI